MKRFLFIAAVAGFLFTPQASMAANGWSDDFKQVLASAKKSGKMIVVEFAGSDW